MLLHINVAPRYLLTINNEGMHSYSTMSQSMLRQKLGWMNAAQAPYCLSLCFLVFYRGLNSSPRTPQVEIICEWQRDNLLLNNPGVCMWVTGPCQSSRWLIKVERGSSWIKDQLIKMSREHASPHFIYLLERRWAETERSEMWEK